MSRRIDVTVISALFVCQWSLLVTIARHYGFDGLYGQDSFAYYNFASALRDTVSTQQELPPFFWPLGYPTLLALGFTINGETAFTAQIISMLLGACLTPLIYILSRQLRQKHLIATFSALIMGICGQAIQSSLVIMADISALFFGILSAIVLLHYTKTHQSKWLVLSAILLAFASITRWLYLILALPWALAVLYTWHWQIKIRSTVYVFIAVLVLFVTQFLYSITTPYPSLNHAWVEGWHITNAFEKEFTNVDGQFNYATINAKFYAQPFF